MFNPMSALNVIIYRQTMLPLKEPNAVLWRVFFHFVIKEILFEYSKVRYLKVVSAFLCTKCNYSLTGDLLSQSLVIVGCLLSIKAPRNTHTHSYPFPKQQSDPTNQRAAAGLLYFWTRAGRTDESEQMTKQPAVAQPLQVQEEAGPKRR